MELFAQKFDYNTVVNVLDRVDLSKSRGFEIFRAKDFRHRRIDKDEASFSLTLSTQEPGGPALRRTVDLLVEALNPLSADSGLPEVTTDSDPNASPAP